MPRTAQPRTSADRDLSLRAKLVGEIKHMGQNQELRWILSLIDHLAIQHQSLRLTVVVLVPLPLFHIVRVAIRLTDLASSRVPSILSYTVCIFTPSFSTPMP